MSHTMGASTTMKFRPLHDADYGGILRSIRPSRDLKLKIHSEPVQSQSIWSASDVADGPSEDSSRCSDYSSCSDLCSSPESPTESLTGGFRLSGASFSSLPNHHNLLSPFSPVARKDQSYSQKSAAIRLSRRDYDANVVIKEDEISGLSTFELSNKRLVVHPKEQLYEKDRYFHPIRESNDSVGYLIKLSDSVVSGSSRSETTIKRNTSIPAHNRIDCDTDVKLDVAQSMTDLFSKEISTSKISRSAGVSTVAIDNKIEQAMDLVKSHLMYAVREEVEVLKEQIKELIEKNQQLEMENAYLKSNATPDLLKQLQAHVDSSPTPPPVMAAPVGSSLQSTLPGNTSAFVTGQFNTQTVPSQIGAGGGGGGGGGSATGIASSAATAAASSANMTQTIGPTGGSNQSIPPSLPSNTSAPTGGGGAYSSSSPSNP